MSRIGKLPIAIPSGVTVEIQGQHVIVKGPKGELKRDLHPKMAIKMEENVITIEKPDESLESRSLHGLTRTLVANMVEGVSKGFEKRLEIIGVGYRAQSNPKKLTLSLGFSHPIEVQAPKDIEFAQDEEKKNIIVVKGIDKEMVGQIAAVIRSYKKPEPYKGKGIRYEGEHVTKKAGKAAGSK